MTRLKRRAVLKMIGLTLSSLVVARCSPPIHLPKPRSTLPPISPSQTPQTTPPFDSRPRQADILVIGAGMAGLSAAHRLQKQGRSVILLEARHRIGGRVWTDTSLGLPLDLGASWIHGIHGNPLTKLADAAGAQRIVTDYENTILYDTNGMRLSEANRQETERLFEELTAQIAAWQNNFENDTSLQAAIDRWIADKRLSESAIRRLLFMVNTSIEHEYAADVKDLSLYWFDSAGEYSGDDVIFPGGYSQLSNFLAQGLDIRLGHLVQVIETDSKGVKAHTRQGIFHAKRAIVTLPVGVLQREAVQFIPKLPASKKKALAGLGFGVLNKVYLQFPHVFWDTNAHLLNYISAQKGRWCEWLNLAALTGAPILLAFNAGEYGLDIEARSDKEIITEAISTLQIIYGKTLPAPQGWLITRWRRDPLSGGSYSSLRPGADPQIYASLAEPVNGQLFFAGEATHSKHPATVHGAYLSGLRAAEEAF